MKIYLSIAIVLCMLVGSAAAQPAPAPVSPEAAALRKTCAEAMNADPAFAGSIVKTAVVQQGRLTEFCGDVETLEAHRSAVADVEKNERHVFMAYAAMWVIAAIFLFYLAMRQQRLKAEILQLRRELDAAAKDGK